MKRAFFVFLILGIISLVFRGWVYRHLVVYKSLGTRTNYSVSNTKLIQYITQNSDLPSNPNIEQIAEQTLRLTSRQLHFTTNKNDKDPNKLINSKAAHCVGYAAFSVTTCNYLLKKYHLTNEWEAKAHIGQLYFCRINIHRYFNSVFFKDHDFITIENKLTGEILAIDPTVNDYLYIDLVTYKKNNVFSFSLLHQ